MAIHKIKDIKRSTYLLALLLISGNLCAQEIPAESQGSPAGLHASWDALLKVYVREDGTVRYTEFLKDRKELQSYLVRLAKTPPKANWTREARLAYYINLYNAGTMALILDNYPVESIRDIKKPWRLKWISVGENRYSLGDIEHKILRKMDDPRIHFAINCASYSCPVLTRDAYREAEIEAQLQDAARIFINDTERNKIAAEGAQISKIFKWFRSDFESPGTSLWDYLNTYSSTKLSTEAPIEFLPYDWSLNDSGQ